MEPPEPRTTPFASTSVRCAGSWSRLQLPAQRTDVDANGVVRGSGGSIPHRTDDLIEGDGTSCSSCQQFEDGELFRGELHFALALNHAPTVEIDRTVGNFAQRAIEGA